MRLLKLLHLAGGLGLTGTLAAPLLLGTRARGGGDTSAAAHDGALALATSLMLPSLGLLVLAGLLLVMARPTLLERRWLLVKLLIGMAVGGLTLLQSRSASPAAQALAGWLALGLTLAAAGLGLRRPGLGQRPAAPTE